MESGFEEGASAGADAPAGAAKGDVTRDVIGIVENDDGFVRLVISGPVGAAADHGLMAADGEFVNDEAFADPISDSLLSENGSGGAGSESEEFAFP